MRILSWLLLGTLTHMALLQRKSTTHTVVQSSGPGTAQSANTNANAQTHVHSTINFIQPVPQEASCHIADHIQVIFAGFAEQSKTSVLHMSSLFHAFTLCQLWTVCFFYTFVYCRLLNL